jgi:AAA+ superfamily predicted ATPase
MSSFKFIKDCFLSIDPSLPIEIIDYIEDEYYDSIIIQNAIKANRTEAQLSDFFGGRKCRVVTVKENHQCQIDISKVNLPSSNFNALDFAHVIKTNKEKGWTLGLGSFGPEYYDLNDLTHSVVSGSSGYGKSSFFKFLLSQTLSFQESVVNYIIDPKKVDFPVFVDHPRVAQVAHTQDEWKSVLSTLSLELAVRENVFNESFTIPATTLSEYTQMKSDFKRNDLPDLPRIIVWIDEAHMLLKDYMSTDLEYMATEYIARKGRSFGIHMIISSQSQNDIPNIIRRQANSSFMFYDPARPIPVSWAGSSFHEKFINKVGRLHYPNERNNDLISIQVPFINSAHAIAMAFGESDISAKFKNCGIHKVGVQDGFFDTAENIQSLCKGADLRSIEYKEKKLGFSRSRNHISFKNYHLYNLMEEIQVSNEPKKPEETVKKTMTEEPRDLLDEFEQMLSTKPSKIVKEETPKLNQKSAILLNKIKTTNNRKDVDQLIHIYKEAIKNTKGFSEYIIGANTNRGLKALKKTLSTSIKNKATETSFSSLALSSEDRTLLERYLTEVQSCLQSKRSMPMLILSGEEGLGKSTIAKSISSYLRADLRQSNADDILVNECDKTDEKDKKVKFVLFTEPDSAINFNRHSSNREAVILIHKVVRNHYGNIENNPDYKYLRDYHIHINLTDTDYAEKEVFANLTTVLLQKHNYVDDINSTTITKLSNSKIGTRPVNLDSIIERSSRRALHLGLKFDHKILDLTLNDFTNNSGSEHQTSKVKVIKPTLTLSDILLEQKNLEDLKDVIHRAQNFDNISYQFMKKLRKGNRMVALFAGAPGTGKSMAAEVIAYESKKDLWVMDFGSMQSPYVGQTEAILSHIFKTAELAGAVLLLDECDSFLTKRSQGNDYKNKVSNHLLNLIENYSGLLVLTTNNVSFLDSAFSRRCDIKSIFSEPSEETLVKMLKRFLLPDAPLEVGFNFDNIFKNLQISGGLLRNAVERVIIKMQRKGIELISEELLRECITEVASENEFINISEKKISLM